mmetsp:Transcript_1791/g.4662  ORF Transcript_1791/g.4662 Transcript_1791/m.4662 type:complete len:177 (+) Transcript_1791:140-670(+)
MDAQRVVERRVIDARPSFLYPATATSRRVEHLSTCCAVHKWKDALRTKNRNSNCSERPKVAQRSMISGFKDVILSLRRKRFRAAARVSYFARIDIRRHNRNRSFPAARTGRGPSGGGIGRNRAKRSEVQANPLPPPNRDEPKLNRIESNRIEDGNPVRPSVRSSSLLPDGPPRLRR